MASMSVRSKKFSPNGYSPKKVPNWIWLALVAVLLFVGGNAIYMATDATADDSAAKSGSSGDSSTSNDSLTQAQAKVQRVADKLAELEAAAADPVARERIMRELQDLVAGLTSSEMQRALATNPDVIGPDVAQRLLDLVNTELALAEAAKKAGNELMQRTHIDNAIAIGVAAQGLSESVDSRVYNDAAKQMDALAQQAFDSALKASKAFWNLGD